MEEGEVSHGGSSQPVSLVKSALICANLRFFFLVCFFLGSSFQAEKLKGEFK